MTHKPVRQHHATRSPQQRVGSAANEQSSTPYVLLALLALLFVKAAVGAPITTPWPVEGPDDSAACAAAALSGWYAVADSFEDSIELRDIRGDLQHTITRAQLESLLPWMDLDASPDGPCGLAFADSGRWLFILVFDDTTAPDGFGSDAVLRYDTSTGALTTYARAELADSTSSFPHLSAVFHMEHLYVGTAPGELLELAAGRNTSFGGLIDSISFGSPVVGLAVDRDDDLLYAATATDIYRADLGSPSLAFVHVGSLGDIRALAYSTHFGHEFVGGGLFALTDDGAGDTRIRFMPPIVAQGFASFVATDHAVMGAQTHDIAATACGRLLAAQDDDAVLIADDADARLDFEAWLDDEFAQVVTYAKGLISPGGEPDGWVIDADVNAGSSPFHPASPDGACWAILLLLMNDEINGDPDAQERVRTVLKRYAGQMPDGYRPGWSADGMMRHWCDPWSTTGAAKPGWPDEFASLSTMKIVLGAARAMQYYPADAEIRSAALSIIRRVTDDSGWDPYIQAGTDALYFVSAGTHPDWGIVGGAYNEGIIFVEQASVYGSQYSADAYGRWLDRGRWPTATYITGQPITGNGAGNFQAAFLSLYPLLVVEDFRSNPDWQQQIENMRASFGAWTDENGPRYRTVFSAGTTKGQWGGYNADDLGWHPGDVSTFTSLMAFGATGRTDDAVGAYHSYRRGARQSWASGASMLYRRSDIDPLYNPNTAGLPDVALGALGLGELLMPGSVEAVLTGDYPSLCPADLTGDGFVNLSDITAFIDAFIAGEPLADLTNDGFINIADVTLFIALFSEGCP